MADAQKTDGYGAGAEKKEVAVPPGEYSPQAKREGRIEDFQKAAMQDRRCNDIFFCILFILFWGGMIVIAVFAFQQGDPRRIVYGTDYEGNICGTNLGSRDLTLYKGLYWPMYSVSSGVNLTFAICVTQCPTDSSPGVCKYGFTPSSATFSSGDCFVAYNSTPVVYRCVPTFSSNATASVLSLLNSPTELFNQALGALRESWWVILSMCGGAVVLSFVWICFLRCCAGCMVWMAIIFVFVAAIAADFFLWFIAFGQNPLSCTPGIGNVQSCVAGVQNIGVSVNSWVLVAFAAALALGIFIFFIVICCMCSRIRLAIQLVKEAARAVGSMPLIFFFPIFIFILVGGLAVYWLFVLLYLASAGGITVAIGGTVLGYVTSDNMKYVMLYHLFGLLWTLGWLLAIGQTTIAGAIGSWYFTYPDPASGDKHVEGWPVARSLGRTLRYHLGSLAFGSFIIAVVQLIRIILAYLERKLKSENANRCLLCVLRCFSCCLACFERFLAFLNKNAYIEIALFGYSFCEAAKTAFEMIMRNILRMTAVDKVGDFLMFMGKVVVSAGCGLGAFLLMSYYLAQIQLYVIVIAVVVILSYFISTGFFAVFQMAIDTMLLCFLEDIERHGPRDDVPGRQFYMSKDLYDMLNPSEKAGHGNSCCCC